MEKPAFHSGELAVQRRAGVRSATRDALARGIREAMPDQHRELFEKLPYVVLGGADDAGRPWATMLFGEPGFLRTPDAQTVIVGARPNPTDPARGIVRPGRKVGLLGIELSTRRRNRLNGFVAAESSAGFTIFAEQSFGNCPQYIQIRAPVVAAPRQGHARALDEPAALSAEASDLVERADTFFIATSSIPGAGDFAGELGPEHGVDVSHRGGRAGFVRVTRPSERAVLTWPDFRGNSMFNTLGNLEINPRAGLYFLDFARGHALSLSGTASVVWDGAELAHFVGAERLVRFEVEEAVLLYDSVPFRWSEAIEAPQLARTGAPKKR